MKKIRLVIAREYWTRVKKKSFLLMTIFGPLLMALVMIIPLWLAMKDKDAQNIIVVDETGQFFYQLKDAGELTFSTTDKDLESIKGAFYDSEYTGILHIDKTIKDNKVKLFYKKQPGIKTIQHIEHAIEQAVEHSKLKQWYNLSLADIERIKTSIDIETVHRDEMGNEEAKNTVLNSALGIGGGILIYSFIFMFGVQVMRGVIEEKSNKIVEVIISSIKPFELMMGKIIGIALVGLTQFLLWAILSSILFSVVQVGFVSMTGADMAALSQTQMDQVSQLGGPEEQAAILKKVEAIIDEIPIVQLLVSFLFYFLGGYLLYASLFAAVGSAVDSEADTQQFLLPLTSPLILAFVLAQFVVEHPDGNLAFWLSMCPFTSPVIMLVRIPFGVELWEICLSILLLVFGFIGTTWLAGRIYRVGILMHGKKITFKELWKWLRYSVS